MQLTTSNNYLYKHTSNIINRPNAVPLAVYNNTGSQIIPGIKTIDAKIWNIFLSEVVAFVFV